MNSVVISVSCVSSPVGPWVLGANGSVPRRHSQHGLRIGLFGRQLGGRLLFARGGHGDDVCMRYAAVAELDDLLAALAACRVPNG